MLNGIEDGDNVSFCGTVSDKTISTERTVLFLEDVSFVEDSSTSPFSKINLPKYYMKQYGLIAYFNDMDSAGKIPIGSTVKCKGKLFRFDQAENYGQFNSREYYYIRGYNARVINCSLLSYAPSHGLAASLFDVKNKVKEVYEACLNEIDAGIICAIMLGDKTELDNEVKDLYQISGIAHILSLSGLHIATLGLALLKILTELIQTIFSRTKLCNDMDTGGIKTKSIAGIIASCLMILYCIMTGMNISTIRALIMFMLGVIASLFGRSYDLLSAAAISSVIAALINPLYIFDAGFQLSFMAVVSIGVLNPLLIQLAGKISKNKITQGILLSLSIQIGTLPIVAYHYYQFSIMSILLNLIVVPLMSLVLICGVVMAVFGLLCGDKFILLFIAKFAGKITHIILMVFDKICKFSSRLKWNLVITGRPNMTQIIAYYFIVLIGIFISARVVGSEVDNNEEYKYYKRIDRLSRRFIGHKDKIIHISKRLILCVFPLMAYVILMIGHQDDYMIHNLSVGQGDCAVIRNKTHAIIIDCGSSDKDQVGCYRLIPFLKANRVINIDSVFVSHFDSDHVNGLIELLEDDFYKSRIDKIFITKAALIIDAQTDNFKNLINDSITCDIPIYAISADDSIMIGDSLIRCLSPRCSLKEEKSDLNNSYGYADTNSASMVLDITDNISGYRMCFTGDVDFAAEEQIVRKPVIGFDYLKVAHHGSYSSTSDNFLNWAFHIDSHDIRYEKKPICVISVGKNNKYGHPHRDTLERLDTAGTRTYRTDLNGECIISLR